MLEHKDVLSIYSTRTHTGELRNLVIRHSGHTNELMVNLVTSYHADLVAALCDHLIEEIGPELTTFVNSITSAKNTVAFGEKIVMHGNGSITDCLGNYTYQISPNSFFSDQYPLKLKFYMNIS